jgi:hypothetical protein
MAEGALFEFAGGIIKSLGSIALQEIGLLWGFKDELQKLKNTVSTIKNVLLDAEEEQAHSYEVRDWLEKLKDALYDADDLLDDYSTQLLRRQVMTRDKMAKQVTTQFLYVHHNIVHIYSIQTFIYLRTTIFTYNHFDIKIFICPEKK